MYVGIGTYFDNQATHLLLVDRTRYTESTVTDTIFECCATLLVLTALESGYPLGAIRSALRLLLVLDLFAQFVNQAVRLVDAVALAAYLLFQVVALAAIVARF